MRIYIELPIPITMNTRLSDFHNMHNIIIRLNKRYLSIWNLDLVSIFAIVLPHLRKLVFAGVQRIHCIDRRLRNSKLSPRWLTKMNTRFANVIIMENALAIGITNVG